MEGGDPQRLPGPPEPGSVHAWTPDGRALYASERHGLTVKVFRRELASGRREPWMEITPADPTGISTLYPLFAADGKSYVYTYVRFLSNLYLIEGLE